MTVYDGPERRAEGQRVVINAVKNGAQADVDELLRIVRKVSKWLRVIGLVVSFGTVGFIFTAGAWYFKVNEHVRNDTIIDANQDQIIGQVTERQARTLGVLEQMDRRLSHLENNP